uniref:Uncharacterized protein n=1 Tax=Anguilla anguilla TaxID=7936 RepID=A0A0E9TG22_ANGAN
MVLMMFIPSAPFTVQMSPEFFNEQASYC